MNPVAMRELLQQAQDRHGGASGRQLAETARAAGYSIDRTQINHILAGAYKSELKPKTLDAIAYLSGWKKADVYALAFVPMPGTPFAAEIPEDADVLSPAQRRVVQAVIRQFIADQRAAARPSPETSIRVGFGAASRQHAQVERQIARHIGAQLEEVPEAAIEDNPGGAAPGQSEESTP